MNILLHKDEFEKQRFTIISGPETSALVGAVRKFIGSSGAGNWVAGDDSSHSWRESSGALPTSIIELVPFDIAQAVAGLPIVRHVAWLNIYNEGEFIAGHRDADGDIQMLVGIDVPAGSNGGQLWLHRRDSIIPMGCGDLLLFEAAKLVHGTTPIAPGSGMRRVTLNVRMWH